jgi:site-specific DNA-methyltransferase (adenine-specific)
MGILMENIYIQDNIKIIHGDSVEVLKELNLDYNKCIFVSDPPFNIGYHYNSYNDKMKKDKYLNWLFNIFGDNKQVIIHYPEFFFEYSFKINVIPTKIVSWVYNSNTAKQHRNIAFFNIKPDFRKVGQEYKNPNDKRIAKRISEGKKARLYDWWNVNQVKNISKDKTEHPCQMPLKIMENIIGILPDDYTIIDPFLGSGTTALACMKYGRNFIGVEIDKTYYEISKKRILNYK